LTVQSEDFKAAGSHKPVIEAYKELAGEGRLPVKVQEQMYFNTLEEIIEFLENGYKSAFKGYENVLSLGPVKILIDGSLGGKTAYLKEPYPGEGDYRGILIHQPDELYKLMKSAHNRNIPAACHAIGDGAVELFLDTVERLQKEHPNKFIRHRVIHCQITDMEILKRIASLNVCVDIEPSFVPTDYNIVSQRVGEEKAKIYEDEVFLR
jgi:predicted amidohydrolase YtcJ